MIETAARGAQFILAIGIAYVIALWFALVAWTFRDIESRSRSVFTQVFSTLLVVLFFVPGLLLYLILRPKETLDHTFQRALEEEYLLQDLEELPLCPGCQRAVDAEFVLCPHCQTRLREPCPSCTRLVDVRWSVCPYCAAPVDGTTSETPAIGLEPIRVLEGSRAGRRERAVAAAAQRVGIGPEELDAFTDALSNTGSHAAFGAGSGRGRGLAPLEDPGRSDRGVRARLGQLLPRVSDGSAGDEPAVSNGVPAAGNSPAPAGFWADPLPGSNTKRDADKVRET